MTPLTLGGAASKQTAFSGTKCSAVPACSPEHLFPPHHVLDSTTVVSQVCDRAWEELLVLGTLREKGLAWVWDTQPGYRIPLHL